MSKQILFLLVFLRGVALLAQNQSEQASIPLNAYGLTFDSASIVINNKNATLDEKYKIVGSITNQVYYDGLVSLFNKVLREGEALGNDSVQMQMYNKLAGINLMHNDFDRAKLYLDSASLSKEKVNSPFVLMYFYDYMGTYYMYMGERDKASEYIYKSIEYAERVGNQEERIVNKLFYLAYMYSQESDWPAIRRIITKMQQQASKVNNPLLDYMINDAQAGYYIARYSALELSSETNTFDLLSDSISFYSQNMIHLYENTPNKSNQMVWESAIRNVYINLVLAETIRTNPDWDKVSKYIEKVESLNIPVNNSIAYLHYLHRKNMAYYKQGKYQLSIEGLLELLEIINYSIEHPDANQTQRFGILQQMAYEVLANDYEAMGDYKKAYEYKVLEAKKITERAKTGAYNAMKEAETKYDVKAKEREIEVLREQKLYQQKIRYLFGGISILLLISLIALVCLYRVKRKAALKDLEIIQMEKDEIELQKNLKEEQARLAELEKYNVLSEIRLIKLEAEGKEMELTKLRKSKKELDRQIELYSSDLKYYEGLINENQERKITELLTEELITFINKKLEDRKEEYLSKLERINDKFIEKLSASNISKTYIKYCICFVLEMDMKDIAQFFSVEVSSIHVMRYRLKNKLNLGNDVDLNLYLLNQLQDTVLH